MTSSSNAVVTQSLLQRPAALAARIVAGVRLDASVDALGQMDAGGAEALHDLRVSLRRLRSWLRTFRPFLDDTVRRRTYRKLKKLVHATNSARDLEVWGEWFETQKDLPPNARSGARYLAECLSREGDSAHARSLDKVQRKLPKLINTVRRELATYSLHVRGGANVDHPMSSAIADALRAEMRRVRRRADGLESLADTDAIHATRIAAKKVRYVVETLEGDAAAEIADALSELQDTLGAVHDMQLLVDRLLDDIEAAGGAEIRQRAQLRLGLETGDRGAAPPRRAVVGLIEIARRARERAESELSRYQNDWVNGRLDEIEVAVARIADELDSAAS